MINLIPPKAEAQVKREYWIRIVSVWVILASSAGLITALLHVPVFVLIQSQLEAYSTEYAEANTENETFKRSEGDITRANEIAALLQKTDEEAYYSSIISRLEELTGSEIRITEYALTHGGEAKGTIAIKGIAASRLALTTFRDLVEKDPLFLTAELPLSNLAKDREIPFSISIIPEAQE